MGLQRLEQPGPADPRQQRVGGDLRFELGPHEGHQAQRPGPAILPERVVQQHQPPGCQLLAPDHDVGTQRHGVGRDPLRRGQLLEHHLGAHRRRPQGRQGHPELLRDLLRLLSGGHGRSVRPALAFLGKARPS